jgi:hypothetical protein
MKLLWFGATMLTGVDFRLLSGDELCTFEARTEDEPNDVVLERGSPLVSGVVDGWRITSFSGDKGVCHTIGDEGSLLADRFIREEVTDSMDGIYTSPDNNTAAIHVRRIWLRFGCINSINMFSWGEG